MENHKPRTRGRAAIVFLPLMLMLMLCLSPAPASAGQSQFCGAADPSAIGGIERDSGIEVQLPNVRDEDLSDAELGLFDEVKPKDTSTMGMIKSSMSAIVVAAAAVVALLVFLAWKRKKNINEREDA